MAKVLYKTVLSGFLKKSGCPVVRRFSCSTRVAVPRNNASEQTKIKPRATKKRVADLPTKVEGVKGALQNSLDEWDGGIPSKTLNAREKSADLTTAIDSPAKRRRKSPKLIEDTLSARTSRKVVSSGVRREPRTQLAKEILENLSKFPHCILLTRVGQFYESYFSQAKEVAHLLNIKLTHKTWDGQYVDMCGFPIVHLDKYLKVLVQNNKRHVALCEEFPLLKDPTSQPNSKLLFERRVTRVLTAGTLIDESFLNPYENNFLLAVHCDETDLDIETEAGLAWIDISTGDFFTEKIKLSSLSDHIIRIRPAEVVLHDHFKSLTPHPVNVALAEEDCPISYSNVDGLPSSPFIADVESTDDSLSALENSAIQLLNSYLVSNLMETKPSTIAPTRSALKDRMQIDGHTLKTLEIQETIREGGKRGSLLSCVNKTVTSSGSRLLANWICAPSISWTEITARQSLVELFISRPSLRSDLTEKLKEAEDVIRVTQRFLLGRGDVDDLLSIQRTIDIWKTIKKRIMLEQDMEAQERRPQTNSSDWLCLKTLLSKLKDLSNLSVRILLAVEGKEGRSKSTVIDDAFEEADIDVSYDNTVPRTDEMPKSKWSIRPEFSTRLTSLHEKLASLHLKKEKLQKKFQKLYDASSLTLRSSPNHGMHVHLGKSRRDSKKLNRSKKFVSIGETNSTKIFFNEEWSTLGNNIFETTAEILAAEREAFHTLREEVNSLSTSIRFNARLMDELDVTMAFANLASEMKFVRPEITDSLVFSVRKGRHPTVELGLLASGNMFHPNSVHLNEDSRLHIITGPNMAGKSTYLRQTALIAILAQSGSFVPADSAEIGIVDKVFSRVGAKDDLFRNRSTFMVEMLETGEILRNATERSLVIMDEVGRGTTVTDGIAIAYATIHHLFLKNKCRSLFATHFHELADMLGYSIEGSQKSFFPGIDFFCTDVFESEDHFSYTYELRPGVNRDSHGLKVAQLGGIPESAVTVAKIVLQRMHNMRNGKSATVKQLTEIGKEFAEHQKD